MNTNYDTETQKFIRLYKSCTDWKTRNALGINPIRPFIERIQKIQTLDEFEALFAEDSFLFFPFNINLKENNGFHYTPLVELYYVFDKNTEEYKAFYKKMFVKFGYSATESERMIDYAYDFESAYNLNGMGNTRNENSSDYKFFTEYNSSSFFTNIPLDRYLSAYGVSKLTYVVLGLNEFKIFESNFTQENLETIKTLCMRKVFSECACLLDKETYDLYQSFIIEKIYGKVVLNSEDEAVVQLLNKYATYYLGNVWYKNCCSKKIISDVENLTYQIIENYKNQIDDWQWLSSGSKYNLITKFNTIKVLVGNSTMDDYSTLQVSDSFFDDIFNVARFVRQIQTKNCFDELDRYKWNHSTQEPNATYNGVNNSINIFAGYIFTHGYNCDLPIEEKLSKIGYMIGHELSLILTANVSNENVTFRFFLPKEAEYLNNNLDKIVKKINTVEVLDGLYCDGDFCKIEICADLFSMQVMLNIAKDYSDFDYKKFFESYAELYCQKYTIEQQELLLKIDNHAPNFLRVNAIVQHFYEFYDAFSIKKGDGMYLDKEQRVLFE